MKAEISKLIEKREELEQQLMKLPKMEKGTVTIQHRKCGKPNCKCMNKVNPIRHGPYYYLVTQNNKNGVRQKYKTHFRLSFEAMLGIAAKKSKNLATDFR
ncbi:hypothetical protein MHK_008345 [Candidatus Magnetomorum sp. HK-1]|nr:hypothetical protein MHK_008345 [Candidatus Magnetomorum sp. HK-1]